MKAFMTGIWFDIGPGYVPESLKRDALTVNPSSPLWSKDEWQNDDGTPRMMTAYSSIGEEYEDLIKLMEKETGLEILEYDTHYCLQVFVEVTNYKGTIPSIQAKLEKFCRRHFLPYVPPPEA